MFRCIMNQTMRTMTTKPSDFPRGCRNVGTNLPFNIFNKNALVVKFIIFFSSGFGLPFLALDFQLKKLQPNIAKNTEKDKNSKVYKFIPEEEEEKKITEIYI